MKTYILNLDPHDDIVSARDKMGWGKSGRILLVWPEGGAPLNRRLDLLLLKRHSAALGAPLALVSRDREVRYHAPRLGIPVFKTLRHAQRSAWRPPRRFRTETEADLPPTSNGAAAPAEIYTPRRALPERPPLSWTPLHPIARLLGFTIGVVAFLSVAAILLPSAEITLKPETRSQNVEIVVQASPETTSVELSGHIPSVWKTAIVEGRDSQTVSGAMTIPDHPASGKVVFTNLTDEEIEIPEGLVVRTMDSASVRFSVAESGSLLPSPGETITLPVTCLALGPQGNLPANSLTGVEGFIGTRISANNPASTRFGRERSEPAPTEADRLELSETLHESLRQTALEELRAGLAEGDLLLPTSLEFVEVLDETYQPPDTQPSDILELSLRLEYRALVISGEDVQTLALAALEATTPARFSPLEGALETEYLTPPVLGGDLVARWELAARRDIRAELSEPQIIQLSLGLPPDTAQELLNAGLPLAAAPVIRLVPDWWPRLPILPFRISVFFLGGQEAR